MITSPARGAGTSDAIVESTKAAGTMIQTLRGAVSLPTNASSESAPAMPVSPARVSTAAGSTS